MSAPDPKPAQALRHRAERHALLHDHLFGAGGAWTLRHCERADCGLLWLDPAPLKEDLALAYGDYYTHGAPPSGRGGLARRAWAGVKDGYLARRFGYCVPGAAWKIPASFALAPFPTRCESLDALVFHLPPVTGGRMLEVGCGAGDSLAALRALGWDVEGLDFDPAAVEVARARGLPAREGDLLAQQYPAASFDAVAMAHVIEHLPDPVAVLAEARRILKPGGRLVAITPNADSLAHQRFGRAWRGLEPPRHLQVFTPAALRRAAASAGLGAIRIVSTARMAAFMHAQSRALATGVKDRSPGFADAVFQWRERLALAGRPLCGEELVLVARPEAPHGA